MSAEVKRFVTLSDHDGTNTDQPIDYIYVFVSQARGIFEEALDIPGKKFDKSLQGVEKTLQQNPGQYGWEVQDQIIAPLGDIYVSARVRAKTAAELVLQREKRWTRENKDEVNTILDSLYRTVSPMFPAVFKPEAHDYLVNMQKLTRLIIPTNSDVLRVSPALQEFIRDAGIQVGVISRDDIDKFFQKGKMDREQEIQERQEFLDTNGIYVMTGMKTYVENDFTQLPATATMPGLSRRILLRRRQYYEAVTFAGYLGEIIAAVGDIYELDDLIPHVVFDATPYLITSEFSSEWEKEFCLRYGMVSNSLTKIKENIEQKIIFQR